MTTRRLVLACLGLALSSGAVSSLAAEEALNVGTSRQLAQADAARMAIMRERNTFLAWSGQMREMGRQFDVVFGQMGGLLALADDVTGAPRNRSVQVRTRVSDARVEIGRRARETARLLVQRVGSKFPEPPFISPAYQDAVEEAKGYFFASIGQPVERVVPLSQALTEDGEKEPDLAKLRVAPGEDIVQMVTETENFVLAAFTRDLSQMVPLQPARVLRLAMRAEVDAMARGHQMLTVGADTPQQAVLKAQMLSGRSIGFAMRALSEIIRRDMVMTNLALERSFAARDALEEADISLGGIGGKVREQQEERKERGRVPSKDRSFLKKIDRLFLQGVSLEHELIDLTAALLEGLEFIEAPGYAGEMSRLIDEIDKRMGRRVFMEAERQDLIAQLNAIRIKREERKLARQRRLDNLRQQ